MKPDVTLSSGREVTFDLYQMTVQEWDHLVDPAQPKDEERDILGKVCGMTREEIEKLPYPDYYKLTQAFVERCRNPLAEPA